MTRAARAGLYKIEPEAFATWVRIMDRVPNSVLWCASASPRPGLMV
jgi:predicted O-linked N-acetylglucosamine transferase (SPINDLY family)